MSDYENEKHQKKMTNVTKRYTKQHSGVIGYYHSFEFNQWNRLGMILDIWNISKTVRRLDEI